MFRFTTSLSSAKKDVLFELDERRVGEVSILSKVDWFDKGGDASGRAGMLPSLICMKKPAACVRIVSVESVSDAIASVEINESKNRMNLYAGREA